MSETLYKQYRDSSQQTLLTASTVLSGSGNRRIECDVSGGSITITLPNACEAAWSHISIVKRGGGTNTVTIAVKTGEGALKQGAAVALATMEDDGDHAMFISDGAYWYTVAQILND